VRGLRPIPDNPRPPQKAWNFRFGKRFCELPHRGATLKTTGRVPSSSAKIPEFSKTLLVPKIWLSKSVWETFAIQPFVEYSCVS
jgi:hypothetical protein